MNTHRVGSFVLLAGGLVLVFAGLSSALGFSAWGMAASAAAIVTLLYAGGVWLSAPASAPDRSVILFTHQLTVANGPLIGQRVADLYPDADGAAIDDQCRKALAGQAARFSAGRLLRFSVSPVRSAEGAVVLGLLLSGAAAEAEAQAVTQLS